MAEDTDSVCVFFEDGTYENRDWDDLGPLEKGTKRYVTLVVYHNQSPGPGRFPNALVFTGGGDNIAVKRVADGLKVQEVTQPPGGPEQATANIFEKGGPAQLLNEVLPAPAYAALGAMTISFYAFPFNDPAYLDLQARAQGKVIELRTGPVPGSGSY